MTVAKLFPSQFAVGGAQPPFEILVAGIVESGRVSEGLLPVRVRNGFREQNTTAVGHMPHGTVVGARTGTLLGGAPTNSTGTVTIASDDFTVPAEVLIGPYTLVTDVDFLANALGATVVATNLAAAIDALPGYAAISAGPLVTVTGPLGHKINPIANRWAFKTFGAIANFTPITPEGGFLDSGLPEPRAMEIL